MRILITAGPTREYLDSVRYLSNASSGRMGIALARAALDRGHVVVLVCGPVELIPPAGARMVPVVTSREMLEACVRHFPACDAAIMAAAVCDYRPVRVARRKLKRGKTPRTVKLEPTPDICALLGKTKHEAQRVIGFALEDRDGRRRAELKLKRKNCDAIILNSPETINARAAMVRIFTPATGWSPPVRGAKPLVAARILKLVEKLASS